MSNFEKKNLILCKTGQKRIIIILTLSMRGPIPHYSRISAAALIRVNVYCLQHRQDNILNFKEQRTHAHSVFVWAFPARSHSRPQSPSFLGHVVLRQGVRYKSSRVALGTRMASSPRIRHRSELAERDGKTPHRD